MKIAAGLQLRGNTVPKKGEKNNRDALRGDARNGLVAISDGVTEASYSDIWAKLLVDAYISNGGFPEEEKELIQFLSDLQQEWNRLVPWDHLESRGVLFLKKAREGAEATFLGVKFSGANWKAIAIGDCNLFLVSATNEIILSWPI